MEVDFRPGNGPASEDDANVEICVRLISGILSAPLRIDLTLGSGSGATGATSKRHRSLPMGLVIVQ